MSVTLIVSTTASPDVFLIVIFPLSVSTFSLKLRTIVASSATLGALSAGTDEVQAHYAGLTTTIGGLTLSMRTEQDGKKYTGTTDLNGNGLTNGANLASAESELSLSYTMGALTVAYAKDTGDKGKFGDEAETLTTLTYDLGGVTIVAKGNDQDETEVSAAFTF